jgi:elongator complex protein 4
MQLEMSSSLVSNNRSHHENTFIRLGSSSPVTQLQIKKSGIRPSFYNKWPQTSCGFPELDKALGGGIPIGSLFILLEDEPTTIYQSILDIFMAQGIAHRHTVGLACSDKDPTQVLRNIPKRRTGAQTNTKETTTETFTNLKIAWRYAQSPKGQIQEATTPDIVSGPAYSHSFDLTEPEDAKQLEKALISCFGDDCWSYDSMLDHMKQHILHSEERGFMSRLIIRSFASSFWEEATYEQLVQFLLLLRRIIRKSTQGCVAMISVSKLSLQKFPSLQAALFHLGDVVLELDSCQGRGTREVSKCVERVRVVIDLVLVGTGKLSRCSQYPQVTSYRKFQHV